MSTGNTSKHFLYVPVSSIVLSVCLHVFLIGLLITVHALDGLSIPFFDKKKDNKEQYQSFIQVDVVALPDQLRNEKPSLDVTKPIVEKPAPEVKQPEAAKKEDILPAPDAKSQKLEKPKEDKKARANEQAKALKQLQEEARREQALKALQVKNAKAGRAKMAGNKLSQGTSAVGLIGTASDRYRSLVIDAIKKHFNIYLWQQRKANLVADIYFEIYPTGKLKTKRVVKPSSDPLYDSAILQAIEEAQPLPLPEDLSLLNEGFQITFKP